MDSMDVLAVNLMLLAILLALLKIAHNIEHSDVARVERIGNNQKALFKVGIVNEKLVDIVDLSKLEDYLAVRPEGREYIVITDRPLQHYELERLKRIWEESQKK